MRFLRSFGQLSLGVVAASLALSLTGCGIGASTSAGSQIGQITGAAFGGSTPIKNGRVRLWVTNTTGGSAGYGVNATELATDQTVTTSATGSFSFDPSGTTYASYTCPAGQFAYITVTGGDAGAGANNNSVQIAALGDCANLSSATAEGNTRVYISEISTVSVAYALASFIGETNPGGGLQNININAPATNNAISSVTGYPTAGYCTTSGSVTQSCVAAGLAHGFANAIALVDQVRYDGTMPTGAAYSQIANNPGASVPQAMLYTLADIESTCVNTSGGTTAGVTSTYYNSTNPCTKLFADTTPPGTTSYPTDTLMAMVNLAKYPHGYANSSTGSARLFAIVPSTGAPFQPTVTAQPLDFSLAIFYPSVTAQVNGTGSNVTTAFTNPQFFTLDINDNVYISDKGSSIGLLEAMGPSGTGLWVASNTTLINPKMVAADTLGNVWLANDGTTSATDKIVGYTASSYGIAQTIAADSYAWSLAIDRANNIWMGRSSSASSPSIEQYVQANSYAAATLTTAPFVSAYTEMLAVDNDQNLWGCTESGTTSEFFVLPNASTSGAPSYPASSTLITQAMTASYVGCSGLSFDSSGNAWAFAAKSSGLYFIDTPTRSGTSITALSTTLATTTTSTTSPGNLQVDGNNIGWIPDSAGTTYVRSSNSSGTLTQTISPCYLPNGGTTCLTTTTGSYYDPQYLQIDSAGNIWVAYLETKSGTASPYTYGPGGMYEILGIAAPTWPQLSYGHAGSKP